MNKPKPFQRIKKLLKYRSIREVADALQIKRQTARDIDMGKCGPNRADLVELLVRTMESLSEEERARVMKPRFEGATFSTAIAGRLMVAATIQSLNH